MWDWRTNSLWVQAHKIRSTLPLSRVTLQQRLQFSTYIGSKVPEWLNLNPDHRKGFLRSWVFSPTNFPSSQEAFPSQKPSLAPGKACHWFSQKYDQIFQYSPSYWVCSWVQMRLQQGAWAHRFGHGNESICQGTLGFTLSILPLLSPRETGKSNRSAQGGPSPLQRLPPCFSHWASALALVHTVTCPGTAFSAEGDS